MTDGTQRLRLLRPIRHHRNSRNTGSIRRSMPLPWLLGWHQPHQEFRLVESGGEEPHHGPPGCGQPRPRSAAKDSRQNKGWHVRHSHPGTGQQADSHHEHEHGRLSSTRHRCLTSGLFLDGCPEYITPGLLGVLTTSSGFGPISAGYRSEENDPGVNSKMFWRSC